MQCQGEAWCSLERGCAPVRDGTSWARARPGWGGACAVVCRAEPAPPSVGPCDWAGGWQGPAAGLAWCIWPRRPGRGHGVGQHVNRSARRWTCCLLWVPELATSVGRVCERVEGWRSVRTKGPGPARTCGQRPAGAQSCPGCQPDSPWPSVSPLQSLGRVVW